MVDNVEIVKQWIEAMNKHNADKMGQYCAEDVAAEEVAEPTPFLGRDAFVKAYRELFSAFPDCKGKVENIFASDAQVAVEMLWEGTHRGDFRGTPPTNKKVKILIAYLFRLRDGKITAIREYYDNYTVMSQMGLV